jgi:hypothetical protein
MPRLNAFLLILLLTVFTAAGAASSKTATDLAYSGSPPLQLTEDPPYELYNVAWPDGSKILCCSDSDPTHTDIYTAPVDGSKVKTKISPGDNTYHYADVNPAGTHICYATGDDNNDIFEIAIYELGGAETTITDNESDGLDSHYPAYNGDGTKIAYVKRDTDGYVDRIFTINPTGVGETEICTLSGFYNRVQSLDWLGSSNELVFTTYGGTLYEVTATAGATPAIVDAGEIYHVCTSNSDGSKIAASCADGAHQKYISINPDGTGKKVIADLESLPTFQEIWCMLCWTADDSAIILLGTEDGVNRDIYLVTSFTNIKASSLGSLKTRFR